jgi:hypothetical protein
VYVAETVAAKNVFVLVKSAGVSVWLAIATV